MLRNCPCIEWHRRSFMRLFTMFKNVACVAKTQQSSENIDVIVCKFASNLTY